MIPGYKKFVLDSPASAASIARIAIVSSTEDTNPSRPSDPSRGLIAVDSVSESLLERTAIQEYEGGLSREEANMAAARWFDSTRPLYESANPDEDPAVVEELYEGHIRNWKPDENDPLPRCPPNTRDNSRLWALFWSSMDSS